LAKIPGGPAGVKGISLFIVPKVRPDGTFNNIELTGLNHKMGQRGLVNCALSFGDSGECIGELVGEAHHGLAYMFQMMNEARIHVGSGAVACAQAGFQASLGYAQERPQGRHPDQKDPSSKPVILVEHADIRRLLLAQKATAEGGLALIFYCTSLVDLESRSPDQTQREQAGLLLEALTPVMKAWPSEFGLEANKHAIQVLGGAGYTRDYPVERYYRDNRLNHIHEGTHGIQGIDLLGRKMTMLKGAARQLLMAKIAADIEQAGSIPAAEEFASALGAACARFNNVTDVLMGELRENPRKGLANATLYLDFTGHIVIAWMWLRIVMAAEEKSAREGETDFTRGKLQTARYFYNRELVRTEGWAKTLLANDASAFDMSVAGF
jgi:butyryl-CoA dehydrogenase